MSMTRRLASIIASAIAVFALAFALTGCGETKQVPTGAEFVGTWDIISMESPEQGDLESMIVLLRESGAKLDIVFEGDGTLLIDIANESADESMKGSWEVKDFNVVTVEVDGAKQDAIIGEDGKLTMEQDGVKMICEKADPNATQNENTDKNASDASANSDSGNTGSQSSENKGDSASASSASADSGNSASSDSVNR